MASSTNIENKVAHTKSERGLGLTTNAAVPDVNNFLVTRMLKEALSTDSASNDISAISKAKAQAYSKGWDGIATEEAKYISEARLLLQKNPVLRLRFGGQGLEASIKLSKMLKNRAEDKAFHLMIDQSAVDLARQSIAENAGLEKTVSEIWSSKELEAVYGYEDI